MTEAATLTSGFTDPANDSARAFRAILDAMARPGRIVSLGASTARRRCIWRARCGDRLAALPRTARVEAS